MCNWLTFPTCSVTENATASDDSRIWAKEAWCENRTLRRDARQVSLKILLKEIKWDQFNNHSWTSLIICLYHQTNIYHHHCFLTKNPKVFKQTWVRKTQGSYIVHLHFFVNVYVYCFIFSVLHILYLYSDLIFLIYLFLFISLLFCFVVLFLSF